MEWTCDENFPKETRAKFLHEFRRKKFNLISRKFAQQLKSDLIPINYQHKSNAPGAYIDLNQIYFATSPLSNPHPIILPHLVPEPRRKSGTIKLLASSNTVNDLELYDQPNCISVSIVSLDNTQAVYSKGVVAFLNYGLGLRLSPQLRTVHLDFKNPSGLHKKLDNFIETTLGGNAIKLDARNLPLEFGRVNPQPNFNIRSSSIQTIDSQIIYDKEMHQILLIPSFSSSRHCKSPKKFEYPFAVEYQVGGYTLKHSFKFPFKFQACPQRLCLKFVFIVNELQEIVLYSQFVVYSLLVAPNGKAASIQIYKTQVPDAQAQMNESQPTKFVKSFLENREIDKYWRTGKRLRFNSVPVKSLSYAGYDVGFNYRYEIKPKPNRELKTFNKREAQERKRDIQRHIQSEICS